MIYNGVDILKIIGLKLSFKNASLLINKVLLNNKILKNIRSSSYIHEKEFTKKN